MGRLHVFNPYVEKNVPWATLSEPSVHSDAFIHIKPDTLLGVGDSNNNTDNSQCLLSSSCASDNAL